MKEETMPTLYYSPGACSLASHIILEEIGSPFDTVRVVLQNGEQMKPEYLAVNPRARVPALAVDGQVLTESPAILTWLARSHPQAGLLPADLWQEAQALSWLGFLSSSVHIAFAGIFRPGRFSSDAAGHAAVADAGKATALKTFADIESRLPESGYVFSSFSIVDAYLTVFHLWARRVGLPLADFPKYTALVNSVLSRPAVQRVMAREGLQVPA
jgi:glutathione S-transferase